MSKIRLMPSVGRCICTICGLYAEAARLKANVCAGCAAAPDKARSLLDARASAARRKAEAAWLQLNHAVDVLGEYAPRWAAMRQALDEYHLLCADDDTRRRVVPAPLAACFRAYEALYWAGDAEKRERVKAEIALVALEDVLSPREAA
jgi:hypothetical protein